MMKIISILIVIMLTFGSASPGMDIWAEFGGNAVYGDGADTCDVGPIDLTIKVYFINNDTDRSLWTTPVTFYGTGSVDSIAGLGVGLNRFSDLNDFCFDNLFQVTENSSDIILPVNNCVYCRGLIPPSESIWRGQYYTLRIFGNIDTDGELCVAQGDFAEDSLDWLFEEPVPQFDTACILVKYRVSGFDCGDINCDGSVNILDIIDMICLQYSGCGYGCDIKLYDVTGNYSFNILDITYLIAFLYQVGPEPICNE